MIIAAAAAVTAAVAVAEGTEAASPVAVAAAAAKKERVLYSASITGHVNSHEAVLVDRRSRDGLMPD